MKKEPVCSLCSGRLERQDDVKIQTGGSNVLSYTRAWVCTNCAAAFPIAIGQGGLLRKARSLHEDQAPRE